MSCPTPPRHTLPLSKPCHAMHRPIYLIYQSLHYFTLCMYICMYVGMCLTLSFFFSREFFSSCLFIHPLTSLCVCMYVCLQACMYVCMNVTSVINTGFIPTLMQYSGRMHSLLNNNNLSQQFKHDIMCTLPNR